MTEVCVYILDKSDQRLCNRALLTLAYLRHALMSKRPIHTAKEAFYLSKETY